MPFSRRLGRMSATIVPAVLIVAVEIAWIGALVYALFRLLG